MGAVGVAGVGGGGKCSGGRVFLAAVEFLAGGHRHGYPGSARAAFSHPPSGCRPYDHTGDDRQPGPIYSDCFALADPQPQPGWGQADLHGLAYLDAASAVKRCDAHTLIRSNLRHSCIEDLITYRNERGPVSPAGGKGGCRAFGERFQRAVLALECQADTEMVDRVGVGLEQVE